MSGGVDVDRLVADASAAIEGARSTEALRQVAAAVTGKKSPLSEAHRALGGLDEAERKELGGMLHRARTTIDELLARRTEVLAYEELTRELASSRLDLTEYVPGLAAAPVGRGHLHLVSQTQQSLEDVFVGMGFEVAEGPEIDPLAEDQALLEASRAAVLALGPVLVVPGHGAPFAPGTPGA